MKICFVSNFNNYYRAPVYRALGERHGLDVEFVFYSGGTEAYWMKEHGIVTGPRQTQLRGVSVMGTRITPGLIPKLLSRPFDVYVKCINGRFALPVSYLAARLRGKPFVLWTEVWMRFRTPGHRLGFPLLRHIYRRADAIVACGDHVRRYLLSEGVEPSRIVVARHAVDNAAYGRAVTEEERAELRTALSIADDAPVILFMGRLTPVKGLSYLIEAFARLVRSGCDGGAVLVLAGAGEQEGELRALVEAEGLRERVRWTGYVPPERTVPLYDMASAMVLPSVEFDHIKETWGLVVNEAFNQGTPVIASDAVGAAAGGLVRDGVTGFVVPERDAEALFRRMADLIADPTLRARMRERCRAEIASWTPAGMAASFAEAIRLAVERRGRDALEPASRTG